MIGRVEETSASFEAGPRLDSTRLRGRDETHVPSATVATRVHHAARRRGGVAARGARATAEDGDAPNE